MNHAMLSPSVQNNLINDRSTQQTLLGLLDVKDGHVLFWDGRKIRMTRCSQLSVEKQRFSVCLNKSNVISS